MMELIVAASLLTLVLGMAWKIMTMFTGADGTTLDRLSRRTILSQTVVIGLEKLYNRLQEGIEITFPPPGKTEPRLEFRDILNHRVTLQTDPSDPRTLVSLCEKTGDVPETGPGCSSREKSQTDPNALGDPFFPAPPVRIRDVKSVTFTPLSAICVRVKLVLNQGNLDFPMEVTMELKNHGLVYQP